MSAGSLRRPPYSFFALILHEIQWMLPPFVFAGLLAYIATPAIEWAIARTRLPRPIFVFLVFALFLLLATLVAYLGIPPLAREMTHVFNDFETIVIGRTEHGAWIVAAGTATPAAADRAYLDGARSS